MIILNKPYVSDFLVETIKKNNFSVLDNEIARKYFTQNELLSDSEACKRYKEKAELIYSNSENSISWISENLPNSKLHQMIEVSKNKALFRQTIKTIFPNYFFKEVSYDDLKNIDVKELSFPLILKPCVGFLSFGVYPIENEKNWEEVILNLGEDIKKLENIFPKEVVNMSNFIIEEMIEGDEYAIDAYFDENSKAVILNIFQHPFFNGKDVSDRAYYTSKAIIKEHLSDFQEILDKIGKVANYKNFPFHLELRVKKDRIIPIELNPMRFCGWCITDIAQYAWGINVYEYFFKKLKPNWDEILNASKDEYFYFTIGDIPSEIDKSEIKNIDYEKYLKNISTPLCVRKIDFKNNPVFAIVFAKTNALQEIKDILKLNMSDFIIK